MDSMFVVLENIAKLKPVSKENFLPMKGKNSYNTLSLPIALFCVQISENTMASQRYISFLKHWIYTFHG